MQQAHSIAPEHVLAGWEEVVALGKKVADFAVIATQDRYKKDPVRPSPSPPPPPFLLFTID